MSESTHPNASTPNTNTKDELPKEIVELIDAIHHLPQDLQTRIQPHLEQVIDSSNRRRRILNLVQDALGQLRIDMKYMMFDLEATRRERDEYRRQIEEA
jgi:hypothetical protein